jgi:hypothetical protein
MGSCNNSWGNWRGGGPDCGNGGGGGAFWIGDFLTLEDAETALISAEPGAYADVFKDSVEITNFFGRFQHQLLGAVHYIRAISPVYLDILGGYDNSVLDLSDPARVEKISGLFATWNGGIAVAGDHEFIYHFLGQSIDDWPSFFMKILISNAGVQPSTNSFFGCGMVDTAAKGTKRQFGGAAILSSGLYPWTQAGMDDGVVAKLSSPGSDVWSPAAMPATPSRVTIAHKALWYVGLDNLVAWTITRAHTAAAATSIAKVTTGGAAQATMTAYGSGIFSSGTAGDVNQVIEVISPVALQVPAGGY